MPDGDFQDPNAMFAQLIGQSNPRAAMLMQLLQARATAAPDQSHRLDMEERLAQAEYELAAAGQQIERLEAVFGVARSRLDDLAAALGACGLCWCEDDRCPGCHGRGRIGAIRPDHATRARLLGQSRLSAPLAETSSHR